MTKLIDLHIHSTASDGEYTPQQIITLAKEKNIGIISITDHDTLNGTIEAMEYYKKNLNNDILIIPGIELSAKTKTGKMHILGYDLNLNNKNIIRDLEFFRAKRVERAVNILDYLQKKFNLYFSQDDISKLLNFNSVGRPHIANLCLARKYVATIQEAYDRFLNEANNKVLKYKTSSEQCINLILNAEDIPVLAHPPTLKQNDEKLEKTIEELCYYGLKGIEVFHSDHSKKDIEKLLMLAKKYNLYCSGGSDFHGPSIKPNIEMATGKNNNLKIKELSILQRRG